MPVPKAITDEGDNLLLVYQGTRQFAAPRAQAGGAKRQLTKTFYSYVELYYLFFHCYPS